VWCGRFCIICRMKYLLAVVVLSVSIVECVAAGQSVPHGGRLMLASPFADHMVLQRDRPVPVWGTGTPGEAVSVEFAGQSLTTSVGSDGRWRVDLAPMSACRKGRTLSVCGGRGATALPFGRDTRGHSRLTGRGGGRDRQ
jgi:hypothetical protein